MKEICLSDAGSEHQATITLVIKYHGEKLQHNGTLETNILEALLISLYKGNGILSSEEENHLMEMSVNFEFEDKINED